MEPGLQPRNPNTQVGREARGAEEWWPSDHWSPASHPCLLTSALASGYSLLSAQQPEGSCRTGISGVVLLCSMVFKSSHLRVTAKSLQAPFTSPVTFIEGILFSVM